MGQNEVFMQNIAKKIKPKESLLSKISPQQINLKDFFIISYLPGRPWRKISRTFIIIRNTAPVP